MSRKRLIIYILTISLVYSLAQATVSFYGDKNLSRCLWLEHKNVKELIDSGKPEKSTLTYITKIISDQHYWILRICLLILIFLTFHYKKIDREKYTFYRNCSLTVIITLLLVSGFLTWSLKIIIGKPRPFTKLDDYLPFSLSMKHQSFPSGHTTETFSYIIPFIYFNKKYYLTAFLLTFGILVSFTRIILSYHYISDVIFGIYMTGLFGYIICYFFEKKQKKKQK